MVGNTDTAQQAQGKINWLWILAGIVAVALAGFFVFHEMKAQKEMSEKMQRVRDAKTLKGLGDVSEN
jgi:type VI protein secretion system component VasF